MIFLFKKKPIVLDCFVTSENIAQTAPITNAIRHIPEWWKKLPNKVYPENTIHPTPTMKKCEGMFDYYNKSVAIPLWADLAIDIKEGGFYNWQFSDFATEAGIHDQSQRGDFLPEHTYGHLKIHNPWSCRTKENIDWVFSCPTYNYEQPERLIIAPGILNFKLQPSLSINMFLNVSKPKRFIVPFGQVLAHLTPMSDRPVDVRRHVITKQEMDQIQSVSAATTFTGMFRSQVKAKEKFKDCPYTGGFK